jgi:putative two-component system response regulator
MPQDKRDTLLIVDDNEDLRIGLKDILTFEGFEVHLAVNGRHALELMHSLRPDLIISDIGMPEMDGYAFYDALRSQPDGITIPFIFLSARGEREDVSLGRSLGAEDYLVKPVTHDELVIAIHSRLQRFRQLQLAQLENAYHAALTALANGIEVRDRYTRGHVERVTAYSLAIAGQMGWNSMRLDALRYGAILHDIGKIFISEEILTKPGSLDPHERHLMTHHPGSGAEMIKHIPYLAVAIPVIHAHHERWDGAGYPEGLRGEAIPLEARIVAIADSFDAITTDRPYHRAASLEEGCAEIERCRGTIYDPSIVDLFNQAYQSGQIHAIAADWTSPGAPHTPIP